MTSPRQIAPARSPPTAPTSAAPPAQSELPAQPVGANDVIFVNGQPFNGRGYPVCGVANQRGRLCGRIGTCPFHARQKAATPKRPRSPNQSSDTLPSQPDSKRTRTPINVRQMPMPPQKSRFKRSWTTEEHRIFLQSMRRHGKGKWKEIASEVKTRTANQCQSHAQKYFLRQAKSDSERKKKSIHDVTEKDVLDSTWNSLQNAARQALAVQQQQNQQQPQLPAQHIAPSPVQSSIIPNTTVPSKQNDGTLQTSTEPHASVTLAPRQPEAVGHRSGIPTMNIAVTTGSCTQPVALTTAHSAAPSCSLASVQSGSGLSSVPVVVPMPGVGIQYASMVPSFLHPGMGNPSNAAIVAPPPPTKTRVTVHVNGRLKGGMALVIPDALDQFFGMAKSKLQFEGTFKRVFTRSGGEIACLDEMCQDDMLWLSTGEDFLTPR